MVMTLMLMLLMLMLASNQEGAESWVVDPNERQEETLE